MLIDLTGWRISVLCLGIGLLVYWKYPSHPFVQSVQKKQSRPRIIMMHTLWIMRRCILLVLPLQPSYTTTVEHEDHSPGYLVFVMDASLSMQGQDLTPNRFQAGAQIIRTLLNQHPEYSSSLLYFAGEPLWYLPFSTDEKSMSEIVQTTSLLDIRNYAPQGREGTSIGDALLFALDILQKKQNIKQGEGHIVLLTDGDDNSTETPEQASYKARAMNTAIHVIALGKESTAIPLETYTIQSGPDHALLQNIADISQGRKWNYDQDNKAPKILDDLIKRTTMITYTEKHKVSLFPELLLIWSLVSLIHAYLLLPYQYRSRSHKRMKP